MIKSGEEQVDNKEEKEEEEEEEEEEKERAKSYMSLKHIN